MLSMTSDSLSSTVFMSYFKNVIFSAVIIGIGAFSVAEAHAEVLDKQVPASHEYADDNYIDVYSNPKQFDPIEPFNRAVYKVNEGIDNVLFKPLARAYRAVVPTWGRDRIHGVLRNLGEPVVFVNAVAQGDVKHSFTTFWRMFFNTTFGLGGMFDFAEQVGLNYRQEDFGQTLGVYGVSSGPYLVIPVLGPSSVRDAVGMVVDFFVDPMTYINDDTVYISYKAVSVIDEREHLLDLTDQIEKVSFDRYATVRSLYLQSRDSAIRNGKLIEAP
ncbi:MAG: VacJ family lipoprotein [Alphaproteobacteria bacterium]|nr:VacJ family lipoprotein [Alphaproteobacteria bacterium]